MNDYPMTWRTDYADLACVICLQPVFTRGEGYVDASPADQVCVVCAQRVAEALPRRAKRLAEAVA